ncbi:hypothetical protein BGX28_001618, partial [Mortierella sp. GBA30]
GSFNDFLRLAEESQRAVTDMVFELSALAHKTLLAIAAGDLYDASLGYDPSIRATFDIRLALPAGFVFRENVTYTLNVAPIPSGLQRHLEVHLDKTAGRDDIMLLLSQDHLQYLYTRFLSPRTGGDEQGLGPGGDGQGESDDDGESIASVNSQASTDINHPVWMTNVGILRTTNVNNITRSPGGTSHTNTEHIRQYATAVINLWEGSILNKLMDYVFRVLLRLYLAPNREQKNKDKVIATAKRKKDAADAKRAARSGKMTRNRWNRRMLLLCNEIADLYGKAYSASVLKRFKDILKAISHLEARKPVAVDKPIPSLQQRAAVAAAAAAAATLVPQSTEPV